MILARVTGAVWATALNARLVGKRLLLCQPVARDGRTREGRALLAVDRVDAGEGDLVLINSEGGGARIHLGDDKIPLKNLILAIVDNLELSDHE